MFSLNDNNENFKNNYSDEQKDLIIKEVFDFMFYFEENGFDFMIYLKKKWNFIISSRENCNFAFSYLFNCIMMH